MSAVIVGVLLFIFAGGYLIMEQRSPEKDGAQNTSEQMETKEEGQFVMPKVNWRIAPAKYETKDSVVMGFDIRDFGVEPDSGVDVTNKIQAALSVLGRDGGGTLFLPEGRYIVKRTLSIPKGVTLCGDWKNPMEDPKIKGTILLVYSGRGNAEGAPFITVLPNAQVRDITIWYPEQMPDGITPYPPTIQLYDPTVWGADYTHVQNCTFVNSYIAIKQGPNASNSPTVQNVYGTALYEGLNVDGLIDVGRFDYINFSPDFWAQSGLEGAPELDGPHKGYIYENATGISVGRVDWSYFTNTRIDGYHTGIRFRSSVNADTGKEDHNFPNGQVFRHTYTNCHTAILIEGLASVGESFAQIKIDQCAIGIQTTANPNAMDTHAQFYDSEINAAEYAVRQEGFGKIQLLGCTIDNGSVYSNNGIVAYTNCEFNNAPEQIILDTGTAGALLTGNRFKEKQVIKNIALCKAEIKEQAAEIAPLKEIPEIEYKVCKPSREELYVVDADKTGKEDASGIIQSQLLKAGEEGGGIVFLPPGNYRLEENLRVPTGVELKGAIDLGRNPINMGTILEVYGGVGDPGGAPAVSLEAGSGIRGLVFNYPEQDYIRIKPYPYAIRGEGADIYVVNIAFRNGYNGLDFMSERCDNHYIEYLAGICLKNAVKIGGGSEGGILINAQMNGNCLTSGNEDKFGKWPNSVAGGNVSEEENNRSLHKYMQENLEVFRIGDVKEEMLFNNFSFFGGKSMVFAEDNKRGASGWCVGQGIDYSSQAIVIEKIQEMQFVNTQLVSFKKDGVTTDYLCQIHLDTDFTGNADFYNSSFWGGADKNLIAGGGNLNLYNAVIVNVSTPSLLVDHNGSADCVNLSYCNDGELNIAQENMERIKITSMTYKNNLRTKTGFAALVPVLKLGERFSVPTNSFSMTQESQILFAENFEGYPASNRNGVERALGITDNFSEFQPPAKEAYAALAVDEDNTCVRLYADGTAVQSYLYNHSMALPVGMESSSYTMETRLKLNEISRNSGARLFCCMHNVKEGAETGTVLLFNFKNDFSFEVDNKSIGTWKEGEWYRIKVELDLRNPADKTYTVSLYDDTNKMLTESDWIPLNSSLQNNTDDFGALIFGALSGTQGQKPGANDILIDYVAVYQ